MDNKDFEKLFNQKEGWFDIEEPASGHKERFLEKLNTQEKTIPLNQNKKRNWWKTISIAASLLLLISIGIGTFSTQKNADDALNPELQQTQLYFASLLEQEVEKINALSTEENKTIIADAMLQLEKLEKDYDTLKNVLLENGESKQILFAMITNFQTRIDLLKNVMEKIEEVEQQKKLNNEYNTI